MKGMSDGLMHQVVGLLKPQLVDKDTMKTLAYKLFAPTETDCRQEAFVDKLVDRVVCIITEKSWQREVILPTDEEYMVCRNLSGYEVSLKPVIQLEQIKDFASFYRFGYTSDVLVNPQQKFTKTYTSDQLNEQDVQQLLTFLEPIAPFRYDIPAFNVKYQLGVQGEKNKRRASEME